MSEKKPPESSSSAMRAETDRSPPGAHDGATERETPAPARAGPRDIQATDTSPLRRDDVPYHGMSLRAGVRLGPCVTVRPLGAGGMGEVWLARNEVEGRDEAVKVLLSPSNDERERKRFVREAQAAMALADCPEIVRAYEIGEEGGRLFIRMEYVRGTSLDHHDDRDPARLVDLFTRMAAALAAGHRRGLVHRDVKPSNFMLASDGRVKLMDFGVARLLGATTLTSTKASLGTPLYMAPEQWHGAREVDARADVYALGVTFYRLLTGELPYDASDVSTPHAYQRKVIDEDPRPIAPVPGRLAALPALILKAMAKRAEDRFADAGELHGALERLARDPAFTLRPPLSEAARARRSRARRAVASVLLVALLAAAVTLVARRASRNPLRAAAMATDAAERQLVAAERHATDDEGPAALEALDAAAKDLAEAGAAIDMALAHGMIAAEAAPSRDLVAEERAALEAVAPVVRALAARRAPEASAALARAASARRSDPAFDALRARAERAASAEADLVAARGLEATDVVAALARASKAEVDALDREGAAALVKDLADRAAAELDAKARDLRARIDVGGDPTALRPELAALDRYPGGASRRALLEPLVAAAHRRAVAATPAAVALARAVALDDGAHRREAIAGYDAALAQAATLSAEARGDLEDALGKKLDDLRQRASWLRTEEEIAAHEAGSAARAAAAAPPPREPPSRPAETAARPAPPAEAPPTPEPPPAGEDASQGEPPPQSGTGGGARPESPQGGPPAGSPPPQAEGSGAPRGGPPRGRR